MLNTDPQAPAFGSGVPIYILSILARTIAPAHIAHGSTVVYSSHPPSRGVPSFCEASMIASISACAVGSCLVSVRLYPLPMILPSLTMTAPIGTSPTAAAFSASFKASSIYFFIRYSIVSYFERVFNRKVHANTTSMRFCSALKYCIFKRFLVI